MSLKLPAIPKTKNPNLQSIYSILTSSPFIDDLELYLKMKTLEETEAKPISEVVYPTLEKMTKLTDPEKQAIGEFVKSIMELNGFSKKKNSSGNDEKEIIGGIFTSGQVYERI